MTGKQLAVNSLSLTEGLTLTLDGSTTFVGTLPIKRASIDYDTGHLPELTVVLTLPYDTTVST